MAATQQATASDDAVLDAFVAASRALVGIAIRSVHAAPVEITLPQHRVLVLLEEAALSVGALGRQLGINQSNSSRLCDRLQRLGLIARQRSTADGRAVEVTLTPAGREILSAVDDARRREVAHVLSKLPELETRAAAHALDLFTRTADGLSRQE